MDRQVSLTVLKGGIDRLRTKGSAKIEHVYDLVNCYVTRDGTVKVRPGTTREETLPSTSIGLVAHAGALHTFVSSSVEWDDDVSTTVTIGTSGSNYGYIDSFETGLIDPDPTEVDGQALEAAFLNGLGTFTVQFAGDVSDQFDIVRVESASSGVYVELAVADADLDTGSSFGWNSAGVGWDGIAGSDRIVTFRKSVPDGYAIDILLHPLEPSAELTDIHFAKPFLGALYVVAEFDTGEIFDYWLQSADEWDSITEYSANEFAVPSTVNGFVYRATRYGSAYPAWSPGVLRTVGNGSSVEPSRIEPTVYNEYYYEAVDTDGDNPRSGSIEPTWPTNDGEEIIENTDGTTPATPNAANPPAPPDANTPQTVTQQKYQS